MCVPIDLLLQEWPAIHKLSLTMPNRITQDMIAKVRNCLSRGKIPLELIFHENGQKLRLTTKEKVALDSEIVAQLEAESIGVRLTI
jgi:hypothetical protein